MRTAPARAAIAALLQTTILYGYWLAAEQYDGKDHPEYADRKQTTEAAARWWGEMVATCLNALDAEEARTR